MDSTKHNSRLSKSQLTSLVDYPFTSSSLDVFKSNGLFKGVLGEMKVKDDMKVVVSNSLETDVDPACHMGLDSLWLCEEGGEWFMGVEELEDISRRR